MKAKFRLTLLVAVVANSLVPLAQSSQQCNPVLTTYPGAHTAYQTNSKDLIFYSGDTLNFFVQMRGECFWMIFWKNSSGDVYNITNNSRLAKEGVQSSGGERTRVPMNPARGFPLDTRTGVETIVLVWSEMPLADIPLIGMTIAQSEISQIRESLNRVGVESLLQGLEHR